MVMAKFGRPATLQRRNTISALDGGDINDMIGPDSLMGDRRGSLPTELVDWSFISNPEPTFSYTSIRDLLQQPSPAGTQWRGPGDRYHPAAATPSNRAAREIPIRNRLVKHAAWAYLQPMSSSPESAGRSFFRPIWTRFSASSIRNPTASCFGFLSECIFSPISRALRRLLAIFSGSGQAASR